MARPLPTLAGALAAAAGLRWLAECALAGDPRWGDGLEFVAVASHLGVAHPPGYPLFTLLLRPLLALPIEPYRAALFLPQAAALAAAALAAGVAWRIAHAFLRPAMAAVGAFAAAAIALSAPLLKEHLAGVEVYTLHAAFLLAAVFLASPRGDEPPSPRALVGLGAVCGFAYANHVSSLCLAPLLGIALWQAWHRGEIPQAVLAAAAAIAPPLLLYGTLPLRLPGPGGQGIGWGWPDSLAAISDGLAGGEYRQFQFLMLSPGQRFDLGSYATFASFRLVDTMRGLGSLLLSGHAALFAGLFVACFAILGLYAAIKHPPTRTAGAGAAAAIALQLAFIFTYNIPDIADYFVGVALLALPFAIFGVDAAAAAGSRDSENGGAGVAAAVAALAVAAGIVGSIRRGPDPLATATAHWRDRAFAALPQGAAVITGGDADLYTIWYEQFARGNRRDLAVVGSNFIRFPWFRSTLSPADPRRDAIKFTGGPPGSLASFAYDLRRCQIEPLLNAGRVFTTINDEQLLSALSPSYEFSPAAELVDSSTMLLLIGEGHVNLGPPRLFEIRRAR